MFRQTTLFITTLATQLALLQWAHSATLSCARAVDTRHPNLIFADLSLEDLIPYPDEIFWQPEHYDPPPRIVESVDLNTLRSFFIQKSARLGEEKWTGFLARFENGIRGILKRLDGVTNLRSGDRPDTNLHIYPINLAYLLVAYDLLPSHYQRVLGDRAAFKKQLVDGQWRRSPDLLANMIWLTRTSQLETIVKMKTFTELCESVASLTTRFGSRECLSVGRRIFANEIPVVNYAGFIDEANAILQLALRAERGYSRDSFLARQRAHDLLKAISTRD